MVNIRNRTGCVRLAWAFFALSVVAPLPALKVWAETASKKIEVLPVLANPEQAEVELRALKILEAPAMLRALETARRAMMASHHAKSADRTKSLEVALQDLGGFAALIAAQDSYDPKLIWHVTPKRKWLGRTVPGSRFIFDNPDNIYRYARIDDASDYVLTAKKMGPNGVFTVTVYDYFTGEEGKKLEGAVAVASEDEMNFNADGMTTITIGPGEGRDGQLHLRTKTGSKVIVVREAMGDWERQRPMQMSLRRSDGPPRVKPLTDESRLKFATKLLADATKTTINFETRYSPLPINAFAPTVRRSFAGNPSMIKLGRFKLASDEVMVITVDPQGARFVGASLTSPWTVTLDYIHQSGSLNNTQVEPNKDGTYTYVISAKDPGVQNWLDTDGLHEGGVAIRWEAMSRPLDNPDNAVKSMRIVKRSELGTSLPSEMRLITPSERRRILADRARAYQARCGVHCEINAGLSGY